jgi:hypothetical protein
VRVEFMGEYYEVSSYEDAIRAKLRKVCAPPGGQAKGHVKFYGELTTYRGRWRFMIKSSDWIIK